MTDINRALGADGAGVAHMTDAAGKEWAFCHLTQSQKAAMVAAAKRKAWKALEVQRRFMSDEQYRLILAEKSDEMVAEKFEWTFRGLGDGLFGFINTDEGTTLLMHHALASKQPSVEPKDVQALFEHDKAGFSEAMKQVILMDPELDPNVRAAATRKS